MTKKCEECGKEIPETSESDYCESCDEMLDKKFDAIEDNILIYKELMDNEVEILKKFDNENIIDLYKDVKAKFLEEDNSLSDEEVSVLNKLRSEFNLTDEHVGSLEDFKKKDPEKKYIEDNGKLLCIECKKEIQEDFNLCPYCGNKLK